MTDNSKGNQGRCYCIKHRKHRLCHNDCECMINVGSKGL